MAIAIEGFTVLGLKARIESKFGGGLLALSGIVPNSTELADEDLWRCSFMAAGDAARFVTRLQEAGLNTTQGPDPDIILVNEFDLSVSPYCEWMQLSRWKKGVIAWRLGTQPRTVVAREGWSPEKGSGLTFASDDAESRLEFVRLEGNVSVYRDKQREQEVYVGRTGSDPDEVFKAASRVIFAHKVDPGQPPLVGDARAEVAQAVAELESICREFPAAWRIHFMIGKGMLALGHLDRAYDSFQQASKLETAHESISRELAGVCLLLGRGDEAIRIGQHAAGLKPDDPHTLGNLACAYLIGGRHNEALTTIRAALKLDAGDRSNLFLQTLIQRVISGEAPQPRNLSDLMKPGGESRPNGMRNAENDKPSFL